MSHSLIADQVSKIYKCFPGPRSLFKELLFGTKDHEVVTALKDISFAVEQGESLGVVGDNGAGKSTLLKIVTGTAFPTSGTLEVQGSITALLELGVGFNPEFTGRRNIYLSGALMGFSREQIYDREDEIIEFSGLRRFIDRPVKTYSSGMHVRLGFALATGFNPSVLVIDEALAVGDQHFQKKCTDRILEFRRQGKTIVFCSHNLYQVKSLCDRVIWLESGEARSVGSASKVVDEYTNAFREQDMSKSDGLMWGAEENAVSLCQIESVRVVNSLGEEATVFQVGESLVIEVWAFFSPSFKGMPGVAIGIVRNDRVIVYATSNVLDEVTLKQLDDNRYYARLVFPNLSLLSGQYYLNVGATDEDNVQCYGAVEKAASFSISSPNRDLGMVRLDHEWDHNSD